MLREAALLTLDVTETALKAGFQLKDASAFNVAFDESAPVFIDIASFDQGFDGAWLGYAQFCDHFLAPLLLESYLGVPYQRYSRGSLGGIPIVELGRMLGWRRLFRRGVLTHVLLRARIERRSRDLSTEKRQSIRRDLSLPLEAVLANIRRMRRLVESLESTASSTWGSYMSSSPYDEEAAVRKAAFVREAAGATAHRRMVWDIGGNDGSYSSLLERSFDTVVVIDSDPGAIDKGYMLARAEGRRAEFAVVDITDPSPSRGWLGAERSGLIQRGTPDLAIWLAVVHHLCIAGEIPLSQFVELLRRTSPEHIVEFVDVADPMAQRLLATRREAPPGYGVAEFEALIDESFLVRSSTRVTETRSLYSLVRK